MSQRDDGRCEELRKAFHGHDRHDQIRYIEEIRRARFSLCPRGLSPSSYRLYESMQLGRCPVVISDDWMPPDGPDWGRFAIFVRESEIRRLPEILPCERDRAEDRGRKAWEAWKEHFSWPRRWDYFLEHVLAFREQVPETPGYERLRAIWRSYAFRHRYQWTLSGRAMQLLVRRYRALIEKPVLEAHT